MNRGFNNSQLLAVGPLTTLCLDFITENKNNTNLTMTTEIFKFYKNSRVFYAQNAERISELIDFKFFWGGPPRGKGPYGPFSGHSRLLHLQWPLVTKVTGTPV